MHWTISPLLITAAFNLDPTNWLRVKLTTLLLYLDLSCGVLTFPPERLHSRFVGFPPPESHLHACTPAVMLYLRRHAGALTCLVIGVLAANGSVGYL